MSMSPQPGRVIRWTRDRTLTNKRGRLVVLPAGNGIRVLVVNELGGTVVDFVAHAGELTMVELPVASLNPFDRARAMIRPNDPIAKVPGTAWFYGRDGTDLAWLPDCNAGAFTYPLAVETPADGNPFTANEKEIET